MCLCDLVAKIHMTNILYLNPAGYIGGAEKSLIDLVTNLSPDRFRPLVLQLSPGPLKNKLEEVGVKCEEISLPPSLFRLSRGAGQSSIFALLASPFLILPVAMRLCRLIRSRGIVIIHTNGIKAHLLGCILSLFTRRILIWHFRDLMEGALRPGIPRAGPLIPREDHRQLEKG